MREITNFENVQAASGEYSRPTAGGYICKIMDVTDVPLNSSTGKGDYLKIEYDIADGEFKGYYKEAFDRFGGNWWASLIRSYKETALGMFKHFTMCVEDSNPGYEWDWNEKGLIGKFVGLVLGEEEYQGNDGSIKKKLYVKDVKTIEQIKKNDFRVPELKKLKIEERKGFELINDIVDDLPFD